MPISTFSELKAAMRDYLGIEASSLYNANLDTAIALAEGRFNATLRNRRQHTTTTVTPDANGEAALPDDYAGFIRCTANGAGGIIDIEEVSPEWMDDEYPIGGGGLVRYVTVEGSILRFRPITTDSVTLRYYATLPALSDSAPTNWLLTLQPGLYLAAALYEHSVLFDDETGSQRFATMLQDQMDQLMNREQAERVATRRLQVKGPTP